MRPDARSIQISHVRPRSASVGGRLGAAAEARTSALILQERETERRHLARELHDGVGQSLTVLHLSLRSLRDALAVGDPAADALDVSLALLTGVHQEVRELSRQLHASPIDELGLVPGLRAHVRRLTQSGGTGIRFEGRMPAPGTRWSSVVEVNAFRIAQEAIANALRHAQAATIDVRVSVGRAALDLRVIDDGAGFDVNVARRLGARHGLGLVSMSERARLSGGHLTVDSAPGVGTTVHLRVRRPVSRMRLDPR